MGDESAVSGRAIRDSASKSPGADKGARKPGAGDTEAELVLPCGEVTESVSVSALGRLCHCNRRGLLLRKDRMRASRRCALE